MKMESQKQDEWVLVTIRGNIDHENSQVFSTELLNLIRNGGIRVRLDLAECDFVSSSGLGAIAAALMVARSRGGEMEVFNASTNVRNLFRTTKLNTIIRMMSKND